MQLDRSYISCMLQISTTGKYPARTLFSDLQAVSSAVHTRQTSQLRRHMPRWESSPSMYFTFRMHSPDSASWHTVYDCPHKPQDLGRPAVHVRLYIFLDRLDLRCTFHNNTLICRAFIRCCILQDCFAASQCVLAWYAASSEIGYVQM